MSLNIQTFSGKVQVNDNLKVGQGHLFVDTAQNKVGLNTSTPVANLHVFGNTFVHNDLRVGSGIVMDQKVATFGTTKTFVVEVVGGVFEIDGVSRPALTFHESQTYIFDQSHNSNGGHPIAFSEAVNGGTPYTTGVTSTGTPGQAGAQTTFKVPVGAPSTLYYYCTQHPSTMGSLSSAPSVVRTDAEIIVSGRLLASSFHGDGANLNNIPASAINGTLSQWVTNGNDIYYSTGGVAIGSSQAPTSTLDVTGSGAFSTTLSVGGSGAFGGDLTVGTGKLFVDVSTGQVGVGTTTPAAGKALDVVGDFQATYLYGDGSNISNITSSQWVTTGTDIYYNTGSVAIGSSQAPTSTLDVTGTGAFSDDVTVGTSKLVVDVSASRVGVNKAAPGYTLDVDGDINFTGNLTQNGSAYGGSGGGGSGGGGVWTEITGTTTDIHYSSGNVGVANSSPQHTLSVGSNLYVEDAGSNVLVVDGNVACNQITLGQFEIVPSYGLDDVTAESNVTTDTVELNNATTGLSTVSNVVVGGELTVSGNAAVSSNLTVTGNATVSSNLVTTGNVQVGKELHMQYTDNVAKIQANSNVVTEFSRSKKLIKYPRVALTQNALNNGYTASASSQESTNRQAWKVFNNTYAEGDGWRSAQTYSSSDGSFTGTFVDFSNGGQTFVAADQGQWLKITLPEKIRLERFRLQPRYSPTTGGATYSYGRSEFVKNGAIWGSNDGSSWDRVYTITHGVPATDTTITEFTVPNSTTAYNNFVLVVTDTHGSSAGLHTSFSEWELYGVPEYDPEAHGTDVTLKSLTNVPNTDWLEVYHDAKDLEDGAVTNPISGLGGTTNNGTAYGNPQISNGAFVLDGTGDYISTPVNADLSNHTASMWIVFDNPSTWEAVYYLGPLTGLSGGNNIAIYVHSDNYFRVESSGGGYFDFDYVFVPGKWVHMTVLFRGASSLQDCEVYIDDVKLSHNGTSSNPTTSYSITGSNNLNIGGRYLTANGLQYPLEGKIANFRLFNRILTSDEIYQLYAYQKEYFGHGDLSMTLKAGRLGIGTSEPRAALDVRGDVYSGCPVFWFASSSSTSGFLNYNQVHVNKGGGIQGDKFIAPISGYYHMTLHNTGNTGTSRTHRLEWFLNGVEIGFDGIFGLYAGTGSNAHYQNIAGSLIWYMNAGDYMQVQVHNSSMNGNLNGWSGFLLST